MSTPKPDSDELPMRDFAHSLPMALLKARESVMVGFRTLLREHGLTEQQWRVLRALIESEGMEVTALAETCFILMPSLSRILAALEDKKLIKRTAVSADRRRAVIAVTGRGRKLVAAIAPESELHYEHIASTVGAEKMQALYALLGEVYRSLSKA